MKRLFAGMIFLVAWIWVAQAPAQLIFGKKAKANPTQRVPELILIVKTDPDERKRASAAEELRDYDAAKFTEIVPMLADVALQDKKQSVRLEAVASLAKIRPVSTIAGQALEKAAADDESIRVRWQAKTALSKYHLAGYVSRKSESGAAKKKQTDEPPLGAGPMTKVAEPLPKLAPMPAAPDFPRPLPRGISTPSTKNGPVAPPVEGPSLFPN